MTSTIRLAANDDAAAIARTYGPFCESTAVSFEYAHLPSTTSRNVSERSLLRIKALFQTPLPRRMCRAVGRRNLRGQKEQGRSVD